MGCRRREKACRTAPARSCSWPAPACSLAARFRLFGEESRVPRDGMFASRDATKNRHQRKPSIEGTAPMLRGGQLLEIISSRFAREITYSMDSPRYVSEYNVPQKEKTDNKHRGGRQ